MKKAYSYFKTAEDIKALGIQIFFEQLFTNVQLVQPNPLLLPLLEQYKYIPMGTEKAKSELQITPILMDIHIRNPQKFTFFSGYQFDVLPEKGLRGFCDFILSKKYNAVFIESPLVMVVEAKLKQVLTDALPQCIAAMYATQIFNERNQEPTPRVYGAVTSGSEWLFIQLENNIATVDIQPYSTANLPQLLGVWQIIIDSF